jgi:hypothetical protein
MLLEYPTFLYELTIYKIYKKDNRVELIYSKYYTCNKCLKERSITSYDTNKKKAKIAYSKLFTLVGAPKEYIESLPKPIKKKKNEKRNSTVRKR